MIEREGLACEGSGPGGEPKPVVRRERRMEGVADAQ